MKRKLTFLVINLLISIFSLSYLPTIWAGSSEDYEPIHSGMKLTYIYIMEHMEQKDKTWIVTVANQSFPESLTYTWERSQKENQAWTGSRILTDLIASRNFNPWFSKDESKATTDTAPWMSLAVLNDLREKGKAAEFREGGSGAINWAPTTLTVKEQTFFPVLINGKPEALHAFRLNKGMIVWNNLKNPLVLHYEPMGIPLFTSITGWKLKEINY